MSNTCSKSKRQFEISEENVIRSIPAYDIVIGKRKDKAVRLFYRQKPTKENVKGEPPCVLCITAIKSLTGTYNYHELKPQSILSAPVRPGTCFGAMLSSFTEPLIGTLVGRKRREPFFWLKFWKR